MRCIASPSVSWAMGRARGAGSRAEPPFRSAEDDYLAYTYNRFQACRFGLDAVYVDPASGLPSTWPGSVARRRVGSVYMPITLRVVSSGVSLR